MNRILTLATLLSLACSAGAHAGAYTDRLRQSEQQQKADDAQEAAASAQKAQLQLQHDVNAYAAKHGGLRDAGDCTPESTQNCLFFATCLPVPGSHIRISQLSETRDRREFDRCQVALGDGSACELTNNFSELYEARNEQANPNARLPKLKATCLDSRNVNHVNYVY